MNMKLRPATLSDADLLLEWRNDLDTRRASHHMEMVPREQHVRWLETTLGNSNRRLFIALEDDIPVGTARADYSDGEWELSWTVAPDSRGRGIAKRMIQMLAKEISDPVRAEVKSDNHASAKVAEHAGMVLDNEQGNIRHYRRASLK